MKHIQQALKDCGLTAECNNHKSNKVLITGYTGTGKTTLANRLGELTGLRVVHLDSYLRHLKLNNPQKVYEKLSVLMITDLLRSPEPMIIEGVQLFRVPTLTYGYCTVLLTTPRLEGAKRHALSADRKQKNKVHAFVLACYRSYIKWGKNAGLQVFFSMFD